MSAPIDGDLLAHLSHHPLNANFATITIERCTSSTTILCTFNGRVRSCNGNNCGKVQCTILRNLHRKISNKRASDVAKFPLLSTGTTIRALHLRLKFFFPPKKEGGRKDGHRS